MARWGFSCYFIHLVLRFLYNTILFILFVILDIAAVSARRRQIFQIKYDVQLLRKLFEHNVRAKIIRIKDDVNPDIPSDFAGYSRISFIADGECNNIELYLKQYAKKRFFYENYFWLVIIKTIEDAKSLFKEVEIFVNADIHIATYNQSEALSRDVYDLYNPSKKHGGQIIVENIGKFNLRDGYSIKVDLEKYWRRKNMTGLTFKSAIVIPQPEGSLDDYLDNEENRQIDSMHRFQSVTIRHCRDYYNFSLVMQRTNSWGYIQANGRFDGLVSLLERKLIDFGSSPLIFKMDRLPFIDYSFGNWILRSTFIFQKPKQVAASYKIFLRPLDTNVWIFILIFMAIILLALKLSFGTESIFSAEDQRVDSSWSMLLLFTIGAFCQQGATCFPRSFSSRILSVFVFFFCILIYQFYSASIVSYILLDPPSTITNLQDLVDSTLETGIEDILIDRNYFMQTQDPVAIDLFNKKIRNPGGDNDSGFYTPALGLSLVRKKGFAYHVETSTAYPIIENTFTNQEICDLEEVQMYRTQPMHTNLVKHSPFKEMLNYCMLRLVEDGLMIRLRRYWDARKPECIATEKKIEIHVSLKEFSCGPIVLSIGVFMTLVMLLYEFFIFNRAKYIKYLKSILNKFKFSESFE